MQKHYKLISKIYKISMAVFTVLLTLAFIACLGHLVFTSSMFGNSTDPTIYSPEKVGFYLKWLSIPFFIYVAALFFGLYFYSRFHISSNEFAKPRPYDILRRIKPFNLSDVVDPINRKILRRNFLIRIIYISVSVVVVLLTIILCFVYLQNGDNYILDSEIISRNAMLFLGALPFALVAILWGFSAAIVLDVTSKQDLEIIKKEKFYKMNKHLPRFSDPKVAATTTNVIRIVVGVVSITFIVLGIFNQGVKDVFIKAINICTECIGLG